MLPQTRLAAAVALPTSLSFPPKTTNLGASITGSLPARDVERLSDCPFDVPMIRILDGTHRLASVR
jgi:hypothetical protein